MEPSQALADLTEISTQVTAAVILDDAGGAAASTLDDERAEELARRARDLLAEADALGSRLGEQRLVQLQVALADGSVFLVRENERVIAATTTPEPTAGLVFYDLRSCLRSLEGETPEASPDGDGEDADAAA